MCRERGGGEAPGTSMSQLNIYPYIIVSLLPSVFPRAWTHRERGSPGAVGRSGVVHKLLWRDCESTRVGPLSVGGGSQDPVTRCLGVCEKGWSDICSEIASFLSTFSFSMRRHLKTTWITNGLLGGRAVWVGNGILPPTQRTSLVETHRVRGNWGSRHLGVGERWGPRWGSRPRDTTGGRKGVCHILTCLFKE